MKLHFNPNQSYQLDAIRAITDIFKGQENSQLSLNVAEGILPEIGTGKTYVYLRTSSSLNNQCFACHKQAWAALNNIAQHLLPQSQAQLKHS